VIYEYNSSKIKGVKMSLSAVERNILDSIVVASENNPLMPEFPVDNPKFPATPTYRIAIDGFPNVFLKDESYNPTGTHKDRLAWEIIVSYRQFLLHKLVSGGDTTLPSMSIISSGSAAYAIQTQLKKYNLPNLKVVLDEQCCQNKAAAMRSLGCELYFTDLSKKCLSTEEILALTNNESGFDITSSNALDPRTRFYDWLSYEIINSSPDYCFIPYGSGHLYENVLNVVKKECNPHTSDPRFKGNLDIVRRCHYMGATVDNPSSKADKLYSPFLPFSVSKKQWLRFFRLSGCCGSQSNIHCIDEVYLDHAIGILTDLNVTFEPSGAGGLALFLQKRQDIDPAQKVLIVNTGKSKI